MSIPEKARLFATSWHFSYAQRVGSLFAVASGSEYPNTASPLRASTLCRSLALTNGDLSIKFPITPERSAL